MGIRNKPLLPLGRLISCLGPIPLSTLQEYQSFHSLGAVVVPWYAKVDHNDRRLHLRFLAAPFFKTRIDSHVARFTSFLLMKKRLSSAMARRFIACDGWNLIFSNQPKLQMELLLCAEYYAEAVAFYKRLVGTEQFHKSMYALFFHALARQGNYAQQIFESSANSLVEKLEFHRFLWQKGSLREAQQIGRSICKLSLAPALRFKFLNNQARVLRDTGDLDQCVRCVSEMEQLLDPKQPGQLPAHTIAHSRALLNYNKAINCFISGNHNAALQLTQESLTDRDSDYEINFLQLRMAKSNILLGRPAEASKLLAAVDTRGIDEWGQSLQNSILAEYYQISLGDLITAEKHWETAIAQLHGVSSAINYANLGKSYLRLAQGRLDDAAWLALNEARTGLIEARILSVVIRSVRRHFKGYRMLKLAQQTHVNWGGQTSYCGHWIYAFMHADAYAFSRGKDSVSPPNLRHYAESNGIPFLDHVRTIARGVNGMPTVFVTYSHAGTTERWVYDFVSFLRDNGIAAEYDNSLRGKGSTVNFDEMMVRQMKESDFVVALLSPEYASRVNDPKTGVAVEYNIMRSDIIRMQLDRYVFCLQSGSFSSSVPSLLEKVDCYDLTTADFSNPDRTLEDVLRHILGIERIDMKPVGARPRLGPRTP